MGANIIVGSSDADQLEELVSVANEIATKLKPCGVSVQFATSIDDVQRKRNSQTLLLIVAAALPQSRSSSVNEQQPALDFISSLHSEPQSLPCILVSDRIEHYRVAQRIKYCELLFVDSSTDYLEYCLQLARKLGVIADASPAPPIAMSLGLAPPPSAQVLSALVPAQALAHRSTNSNYAVVEVDLPANLNMAAVRLEIHDGVEVRRGSEALRLNKSKVAQLVKECRDLKRKLSNWHAHPERFYDRWQIEYQRLGERFGRLLWSTQSFSDFYSQGIGAANGNVRVRFNLEQPWFDGLWEAIPVRKSQRFLMLENTIARRALQRDRLSVFSSDTNRTDAQCGTLRILVIKSNVADHSIPENPDNPLWSREWRQYGGTLPKLGHLDDEVDALCALSDIKKAKVDPSLVDVKVDVLPAADYVPGEPWSLAKETRTALETASQCYDIVHFAGHAMFFEGSKGNGRGYLVFSGHPRPRAVSIATVATWLAKASVQLVYLSCCRSSAASAALEFARNNIPMAIGFHWDVDDKKAPVFAKEFYQELLKARLRVCPAVNRARLNLYNDSQGVDPIWASPVLIAQPMDWMQVEPVLKLTGSRMHPDRQAA